MNFKIPKNTEKFSWTNHSTRKMMQYQLSEARVKRVMNNPKRKELGIAPGTIAVMQPNSSKHSYEVWVMYQLIKSKVKSQKLKVITAWKYPGKSPIRGQIPIPLEILEELGEIINE
ncbi:MAG: hypothetical protein Q8N59_02650 [bacterium]|nr:hypothetical protein [bacterium]